MFGRGLLLIKIGEDSKIAWINTYLKLIERGNPQIAFIMTSNEKKSFLVRDLSNLAEVCKFHHCFGLVGYFGYHKGLLSNQKGLVKRNLERVETVYPKICAVFASLVS